MSKRKHTSEDVAVAVAEAEAEQPVRKRSRKLAEVPIVDYDQQLPTVAEAGAAAMEIESAPRPLDAFQDQLVGDETLLLQTLYERCDNAGRQAYRLGNDDYLSEIPQVEYCASAAWWADGRKLVQEAVLNGCRKAPPMQFMAPDEEFDWHLQFLRVPSSVEFGCSLGARCQGMQKDDFRRVLVAYEERNGHRSNPPMCLLDTRMTWDAVACATIASVPEFHLELTSQPQVAGPAAAAAGCINSHSVLVGCLGGYNASYLRRMPDQSTSIPGFSGQILRYSLTHYEVDPADPTKLTMNALLFQ